MDILNRTVELPFAYQHRKGFEGKAPGLYFRYFETEDAAKKSMAHMDRKGKWHGPLVNRPGEAYVLGNVLL